MLVVCRGNMSGGSDKASLSVLDGVQWCRRRIAIDGAVDTAIVVAYRREAHASSP